MLLTPLDKSHHPLPSRRLLPSTHFAHHQTSSTIRLLLLYLTHQQTPLVSKLRPPTDSSHYLIPRTPSDCQLSVRLCLPSCHQTLPVSRLLPPTDSSHYLIPCTPSDSANYQSDSACHQTPPVSRLCPQTDFINRPPTNRLFNIRYELVTPSDCVYH